MNSLKEAIENHFGWFGVASISLVIFALYQHTLGSGFILDDATSIRVEPLMIQDDILPLYEKFKLRFVGYLSFWANYQISGEDPAAFRLVNICIHSVNGMLVYWLSVRLLSSFGGAPALPLRQQWIALGIALVFVAHPLQTQAVTYIVQRLASLMALFYLGALCCWVEIYRSSRLSSKALWGILFALCTLAACFTKENAFTLPLILLLMEALLFRRFSLRQWVGAGAVLGVLCLVVLLSSEGLLELVDRRTRETPNISRWEYFSHQWVVLWIYLSKVIWPYPQLLDYGIQLDSFGRSATIMAGMAHVLFAGLGLVLWRRLPLATFGILFFYITHSVESGLIPIRDLAFEHRNYLPIFGVFLSVGAVILHLKDRSLVATNGLILIFLGLFVFFAQATWARNQMWVNQEALLKHDIAHTEGNVRALYNLSVWYQRNGRYDDSIEAMKAVVKANQGRLDLLHATTYVAALIDLDLHDRALSILDKVLDMPMNPMARAAFLRQYGTVLTAKADDEAAADVFEESMIVSPLDYDGGLAYGYSLIQLGRFSDAKRFLVQLERRFGQRTRLKMLNGVLSHEKKLRESKAGSR